MKYFWTIILIVSLVAPAFSAELKVTELTPSHISGTVLKTELPTAKLKVVVYLKNIDGTWTKQPFAGEQEGYSWAPISQDGTWYLKMVERFSQKMKFATNYMVLVVHQKYMAPDRTKEIHNVVLNAKAHQELRIPLLGGEVEVIPDAK